MGATKYDDIMMEYKKKLEREHKYLLRNIRMADQGMEKGHRLL
jgi:hypothetical protein